MIKVVMSDSPFLDNREKLFENSKGFVIYDKFPASEGHCLVIPERVYSNYFDSTEEEIAALNQLVFETKLFLDEKYQPSGYNVGINCGEDAGQTVNHVHIHVIPRYKGDVTNPEGGVRGVIPDKQKYT
jgi:diadenosine tetraphosphate (Ap4A) HIT family hydrolase